MMEEQRPGSPKNMGSGPSSYDLSPAPSVSHWVFGLGFLAGTTGHGPRAASQRGPLNALDPQKMLQETFKTNIVWPKILRKFCMFSPHGRRTISMSHRHQAVSHRRHLVRPIRPACPKPTWAQDAFVHKTSLNINCALCKTYRTGGHFQF